jgi:hypothetical protein
MKKVAIPVLNGKLSQYFGQCSHFLVFEGKRGNTPGQRLDSPLFNSAAEIPAWASKLGITDMIVYKIDPELLPFFIKNKINLFVGVSSDDPSRLFDDYLNGRLNSNEKIIRELTEKN